MKIENSTDWPDAFLRRMVGWCCRELKIKKQWVRLAKFKNTRNLSSYGGNGGHGEISIRISKTESSFPTEPNGFKYGGIVVPALLDRIDALVAITAHELQHVQQMATRRWANLKKFKTHESDAMQAQIKVMAAFRANPLELQSIWHGPAPTEKPVPVVSSVVELRAVRAEQNLERWQRKLKAAQNKVRKYRGQVRYYQRKQAAAKPAR